MYKVPNVMDLPCTSSMRNEACDTCRERKVKCDRQRPACASCRIAKCVCNYSGGCSSSSNRQGRSEIIVIRLNSRCDTHGRLTTTDSIRPNEFAVLVKSGGSPTASGRISGAPGRLKFVTIDHPDAALTHENRTVVRSHAMLNYKHRQRTQSLQSLQSDADKLVSPSKSRVAQSVGLSPVKNVGENTTSDTSETLELPPLYQPSRIIIFGQFFMSHFLSLTALDTDATAASFLCHMPEYISSSTNMPLRQSAYALLTSFYGFMTQDKDIQLQSRIPYASALQGLDKRICQMAQREQSQLTEFDVCTPLLLMIYELTTGETIDGWWQHIRGAEKLFLTQEPELYQSGLAHDVARFLRFSVGIVACLHRKPTALGAEPWTNLFSKTPKLPFDILIDNLLGIPSLLYGLDSIRSEWGTTYTISDAQLLYSKALDIKFALENWFTLFLQDEFLKDKFNHLSKDELHQGTDDLVRQSGPPLRVYQDGIATVEVCVFIASMVLILSILRDVVAPPVPAMYNFQMVRYSEIILSTMSYVDSTWGSTKGPLNYIFPLRVIAALNPDVVQRECARAKLARWNKCIGSGGYPRVVPVTRGNLYEINGRNEG